ncbi:hypothetical protein ND00_00920 [Clostridium sp. L74]|nr:hypothetical protein ND00_00920 [Clostridium sp. L74]
MSTKSSRLLILFLINEILSPTKEHSRISSVSFLNLELDIFLPSVYSIISSDSSSLKDINTFPNLFNFILLFISRAIFEMPFFI